MCVHNTNIKIKVQNNNIISIVRESRAGSTVLSLLLILRGRGPQEPLWAVCADTYLGGRRGRGGGLSDLDVLHLDGVLGVGLRVMELAHVHSGLLGLVRGGGLEGKQMHTD